MPTCTPNRDFKKGSFCFYFFPGAVDIAVISERRWPGVPPLYGDCRLPKCNTFLMNLPGGDGQ
jgi:hypothetical protein